MRVARLITESADLAGLQDAWRDLAAHAEHPFQEFGWSSAWLRTFGANRNLHPHIAILSEGPRLLALLPLMVRSKAGLRILEWLAGRESDFCDALVHPSIDRSTAIRDLWQCLSSEGAFDVARLSHVRADAGIAELLHETAPWVATTEEDLFLPLPTGGSVSWLSGLNKGLRSDIRQRTRRMEKLGFHFSICDSRVSLDRALDAVIKQKQAWARSRGVWSFITAPAGPAFLREMAYNLFASGTLHLSFLHSGAQIAAAHLGFLRGGCLYYYMPTFDRSLGNHGFGSVLQERLIMWACDNGVRRFDMLLGAEAYKARFQPSADPVRTYVVARTALGSLALRAARAYARFRNANVSAAQS